MIEWCFCDSWITQWFWWLILGQSYMGTWILTSLLVSIGISTFASKVFFFAGYLRLAMLTVNRVQSLAASVQLTKTRPSLLPARIPTVNGPNLIKWAPEKVVLGMSSVVAGCSNIVCGMDQAYQADEGRRHLEKKPKSLWFLNGLPWKVTIFKRYIIILIIYFYGPCSSLLR